MTDKLRSILIYSLWALADAFLLASAVTLTTAVHNGSVIFYIQSVSELNLWLLAGTGALLWAVLTALFILRKQVYRWITPVCALVFSMAGLNTSVGIYAYATLALCAFTAGLTLAVRWRLPEERLSFLKGRLLYIAVGAVAVFMTVMVSVGTIARHEGYGTSTFDFGIFAQMFESMATDFSQNTTLERDALLSHFTVHCSPIYYLLLPFYMIFRCPQFLLAAQAAICFSGVIPLLLLLKKFRYSDVMSFFICCVYCFYPAFSAACFYDFHENAFLTPLILWTLYFLEKKQILGVVISALLLLCVKEDAGFYVVFIGFYALFNKNSSRLSALLLIVMGIAGFFISTAVVDTIGEGIKVSRYNIYLTSGQDSLVDVVLNVLKNPIFFFSKLLSEQKLLFLLQMCAPLLFIAFYSRKLCDWMLILPMVLLNLAPDYSYQSDINYQYVFGTGALLVFLFAKNIRYVRNCGKVAVAAAMAALVCLVGFTAPKYDYLKRPAVPEPTLTDEALDSIPRDSVIFATTFLTPHLYNCPNVYMYPDIYKIDPELTPDYICLDSRSDVVAEYYDLIKEWTGKGYTIVSTQGYATILKRPSTVDS